MNITTAERREQYKAAMRNVRVLRDGKNGDRRADAVTAVADEEITEALRIADAAHDAKVRELEAENARLRKQAAEVRAADHAEAADVADMIAAGYQAAGLAQASDGARAVATELRRLATPDDTTGA
ncbi:hypothetical protein LHJ74_14525 [Streptomyces sp. N2-109]|uniref:Uncharacterized protein n=1 Tax=Streptomyces gossypii TaxID=2883101 RepID=A0ABT2JUF8_9ACTN|nr:hypothetical protein [Streptomyces gossypii]MCT2591109.1 hypothetical protein [Streptomyces gossypii]